MPRIRLPRIKFPRIKLPRIKFPTLKLPRFYFKKEKRQIREFEKKRDSSVGKVSKIGKEINDSVSKVFTTIFRKKFWKSLVQKFKKVFIRKKRHEKTIKKIDSTIETPTFKKGLKFKKGIASINQKIKDVKKAVLRFFILKKKSSKDIIKEFFQKMQNKGVIEDSQKKRSIFKKLKFPMERWKKRVEKDIVKGVVDQVEEKIVDNVMKKKPSRKNVSGKNSETKLDKL